MSLVLQNPGTEPGIEVKTWGIGDLREIVLIGGREIAMVDFLFAAHYVLTNTDLGPNDPRLQFVESVRTMRPVGGFNQDGKRLRSDVPLVFRR